MKQSIQESTVGARMTEAINPKGMNWTPEWTAPLISGMILSLTQFAKTVKDKEQKVSIEVVDYSSAFRLAAIVSYSKPENEDDTGEWNYVMTFNEEDVANVEKRITIVDSFFTSIAIATCANELGMQFTNQSFVATLFCEASRILKDWLDQNVTETEEASLFLDGYIEEASCVIENGVKVFTITPSEEMKQCVKSDVNIQR